MTWTAPFLPPTLARILFASKLDKPLKTVWRFVDFAEFCMIYGMSNSLEAMASALCMSFQHHLMNIHKADAVQCPLPSAPSANVGHGSDGTCVKDRESVSTSNMQLLLYLLSLPSAAYDNVQGNVPGGGVMTEVLLGHYKRYCNPVVLRDLAAIEEVSRGGSSGPSLQPYVHTICQNYAVLPGLKLLSMTACCLFGLRPSVPALENEYIAELMLWNQQVGEEEG